MNKGDLITCVANEMESTRNDATKAVEAVLQAIAIGLRDSDRVTLTGFGTFQRKERGPRICINPTTREPMHIDATTTCTFRPSTALREAI